MASESVSFLPEVRILHLTLIHHLNWLSRYSPDLTPDQKDALLDVIRVNPHPQIGLEVRRELVNSVARGEPRPDTQDVDMS